MPVEKYQPNEILEQGSVVSPKQEIIYYRPKFHRRVLANLIDIFVFVIIFASLFLATRAIVSNTSTYQNNMAQLEEIRLNSGLYTKDKTNNTTDIITYLNSDSGFNNEYKKVMASEAIDKFFDYAKEVCIEVTYLEMKENYNKFRLDDSMIYKHEGSTYDGAKLFLQDDSGAIYENPDLIEPSHYVPEIYWYYYSNVYQSYIDSVAQGYLITKIPYYYDLLQYLSIIIIFAVIVPAYLLAGILVYYVPTLFFTRGRSTLGKALYRIGLVDQQILSPRFGRTTARFAIFYFGELILSIVTFGLPYLLSFSLICFSKNKQGFPDYMLGLTEVDMSRTKIYKSFDEVDLDNIKPYGKAVDFKVPNYD